MLGGMAHYSFIFVAALAVTASAYACASSSTEDDGGTTSPASSGNTTATNASSTSTNGSGGSGAAGGASQGGGGANQAGAGGSAAGGSASGGASQGGAGGSSSCGNIGMPCTGTCPDNLICYADGLQPFCVPAQPPICGGFANAMCPISEPFCLYLTGADFGPCFTSFVKQCVCLNSPSAVFGC
jgi:hypothetical protein